MKELVIDLESAPHRYDEYCQAFPDKVTTKKDGTKTTKKQPGLHSIISEVCCVGLEDVATEESQIISRSTLASEEDILVGLYRALKPLQNWKMVSFNGESFDSQLLRLRGALYGIPLAKVLPKPRSCNHVDIYASWLGGKWQTDISACSLSELAWYLLGESKESDGGSVAEWFAQKNYAAIDSHCLEDIDKTTRIYKKLKDVMF